MGSDCWWACIGGVFVRFPAPHAARGGTYALYLVGSMLG